jgi:hypothetical protein
MGLVRWSKRMSSRKALNCDCSLRFVSLLRQGDAGSVRPGLRLCIAVKKHFPGVDVLRAQNSHRLPRILGQALTNVTLGGCLDDVQDPLTVTEGTTSNDEPACGQGIHERGVL